jgi:hypothetical protein
MDLAPRSSSSADGFGQEGLGKQNTCVPGPTAGMEPANPALAGS